MSKGTAAPNDSGLASG